MKFYHGNDTDESFAVYVQDGVCRPVFAEKYSEVAIPFDNAMREITTPKTIEALYKYLHPYEAGKPKVYMAGPLFNEGDRYCNLILSDALRAEGYTTFLPQEVVIDKDSDALVKAACLYMDLKAIRLCDYLVANCNGLEMDSGTAAEIGLGYGLHKKMLAYKSDVRNYYNETYRLNNFVGGLINNLICTTPKEVSDALKTL
ncbi:MAG TPA: nucleoside 2-deoxyribosyltransferase [Eubacteriales bacterium]|nr:nucleoside 2-deoxyribosyltransferase [Eubacteriales bacterium]